MTPRALTAFVAAAAWLALAAPVASAKEGVVAEVTTPVPAGADPGERVTVAWTLTVLDDGVRRPFGAGELYVRLDSASGGRATTAWVSDVGHPPGRYTASIVVPEGGVGAVEFGIRGYVDGVPSDHAFPIVNDALVGDRGDAAGEPSPATGAAQRPPPGTEGRSAGVRAGALAAGVIAALAGTAAAAAGLRRARRAGVRR